MQTTKFDPDAIAQMAQLAQDFGQMYRERNEALQEVVTAHHEALMRLAIAAEMRDDDTGLHLVRIGLLAEKLAQLMGCDPVLCGRLRLAAPMHDIGKIGIADRVLKKPGSLTPEERDEMKKHPEVGAKILGRSRIPLFQMAAEVALYHHERWNGTGYPQGIQGLEIPLVARLVSVVDFYDAVTTHRVYRAPMSDEQAQSLLLEERGRAFDPAVVDVFMAHKDRLIDIRRQVEAHGFSIEDLVRLPGGAEQWRAVGDLA